MPRATASVLFVLAVAANAHAQTLDEVTFKASQVIIEYQKALSGVAADETSVQEILGPEGKVKQTRTLTAEYVLTFATEQDVWSDFRDVVEVDGKTIRAPDGRLQKLIASGTASAAGEARKIARDSARQNIGDVRGAVDIPTLALVVLSPFNQYRFYFEKTGEETIDGVGVWVVAFSEHMRPTLLRGGGGDLFARGSFWIDPQRGRVLKSHLIVGDLNSPSRSTYEVTFKPAPQFDMLVPAEMREEHDAPRTPRADRVIRRTIFANFRRFEIAGEESLRSGR